VSAPPPGTPVETRAVVERLLERIGAGDWDGAAALFADEFEWRLGWPDDELAGAVPWIRARRTQADVRAHFAALAAHNAPDGPGTTVERVLVEGGDAVVLGTIRNVLRRPNTGGAAAGTPYRADFALHLAVEGGRVRRYHVIEDSLAVSKAWHAST
jgi:ketosteroid isomerase-like protein